MRLQAGMGGTWWRGVGWSSGMAAWAGSRTAQCEQHQLHNGVVAQQHRVGWSSGTARHGMASTAGWKHSVAMASWLGMVEQW